MDADVPPYVRRGRFPFSGAPCETTLNTMCWAALGLLWSLTRFLLSLCLLSPTITHNAFLLLHGSLEVCWVCFHTQEVGWVKLRLCVCMYVCVYVRVFAFTVFVCAGKGEQWEGKKVYLTCWQSCFSKIHECEKKKREEKQQKTDTESPLLKPRSPLFYFFKQTLGGLDKLLRDQLYFESGDSDRVRKPRGVAMTKIKKNICS